MQGSIKKLKGDKGFGFVRPADGSADIFFHFTGVVGGIQAFEALSENQSVSFDVENGKKGQQAINVSASAANDESYDLAEAA